MRCCVAATPALAASAGLPGPGDDQRPDRPVVAYWERFYTDADPRAGDYANRYHSSYVLIFGLAAVTLVAAVVAVAVGWLTWATAALELAALLVVLVLVVANHRQHWHQRWIEYRLLAELWRKQQALARVGWSLAG